MSSKRSEGEQLPTKMASLELLDGGDNSQTEESNLKRSLRKRNHSPVKPAAVPNRRVKLKPKKITSLEVSKDEIEKMYCDPKVNTVAQRLETIFEEPKTVNNQLLFIGGKKIKRSLKFHECPMNTKEKIKKRRSKIKRLLGSKSFANRKKLTMQAFQKTLQSLEADDSADELMSK